MSKFIVHLERKSYTLGKYEVEAEDAVEAYSIVWEMDDDDLDYLAEWGSCGDTEEIGLTGEVEEVFEPTVSEGLWR